MKAGIPASMAMPKPLANTVGIAASMPAREKKAGIMDTVVAKALQQIFLVIYEKDWTPMAVK
jgi:hypothetical protein